MPLTATTTATTTVAATSTASPTPAPPVPSPTQREPGKPRRHESGLVGRLNAEWNRLIDDRATASAVSGWSVAEPALRRCRSLVEVERAVAVGDRERTDAVLLALLRIGHDGDHLAHRVVFQLMLGKAVRIAVTHAGRDTRDALEHAAVTALWTVVAGYPVDRRPTKVAANVAMDTLRLTVTELAYQRHETPTGPEHLDTPVGDTARRPADLELLELLAWAVDAGTVTAADATLIMDIYAPGPGCDGGAAAAARYGLSWPAARQRASRAVRRITSAVRADSLNPVGAEA